MSIRIWNIDPQDGIMTWQIPGTASLPLPFRWQYGVEACDNQSLEVDDSSNEKSRPNLGTFLRMTIPAHQAATEHGLGVAEGNETTFRVAPLDCQSESRYLDLTPNDSWWDLNEPNTPGRLTVTTHSIYGEAASLTLTSYSAGSNPPSLLLSAALGDDVMRAICWRESRWRHFQEDGSPMRNSNANGTIDWGCMQINQATNREIWHWPTNVNRAKILFAEKLAAARVWLNKHSPFTDEMLQNEAIQRYNGGAYYQWDESSTSWKANPPNGYANAIRILIQTKPWPQ